MISLYPNSLYFEDGLNDEKIWYRILWIDENNILAYVINITENKMPVKTTVQEIGKKIKLGEYIYSSIDPFAKLLNEEELIPEHKATMEKRWAIIGPIVANTPEILESNTRGTAIKQGLNGKKMHRKTIYNWLRKYWQRGQTKDSLLPDYENSGAPGVERVGGSVKLGRKYENSGITEGINITPEIKEDMVKFFTKHYSHVNKPSKHSIYKKYIKERYTDPRRKELNKKGIFDVDTNELLYEIPSYREFHYWTNKEADKVQIAMKRIGNRKYKKDHRAKTKSSNEFITGPGDVYQIDSTTGNVGIVLDTDPNKIIGRPTVYLIVDVFSRLITGFLVSIRPASLDLARLALYNAFTNKVDCCKQLGINIKKHDWAAEHKPSALVADRGELRAIEGAGLAERLGMNIKNTPSYRPELKGIVEKMLDKIQERLAPHTPGRITKDYGQRGTKNPYLDAVLTIHDYRKMIVEEIIIHNNTIMPKYQLDFEMKLDQIPAIPSVLWEWGIKKRTGSLHFISKEELMFKLLPTGKAIITTEGLKFKQHYYTSDFAISNQWFENRKNNTDRIVVSYYPSDMKTIYYFDSTEKKYINFTISKKSQNYLSYDMDVMEAERKEESLKKQPYMKEKFAKEIDIDTKHTEVVNAAVKRKETVLPFLQESDAQKLSNIRENKKEARNNELKTETLPLPHLLNKETNTNEEVTQEEYSQNHKDDLSDLSNLKKKELDRRRAMRNRLMNNQ